MAHKKQSFDVWIVESNTVYREVPFTVVTDWVQQGRLLEEDQLRPTGSKEWKSLGSLPAVAAYLPRPDPFRVEDRAEALEPVEVDFAWKSRPPDEEEDVDMIPLIDVSLVLLIFFMMTASVVAAGSFINTPEATQGSHLHGDPGVLWLGVTREGGRLVYSLGRGQGAPLEGARALTRDEVLRRFDAELAPAEPKEVRIAAERHVPVEVVHELGALVEQRRNRKMGVGKIYYEVSQRDIK